MDVLKVSEFERLNYHFQTQKTSEKRNVCSVCRKRYARIKLSGIFHCERCFKKFQKEQKWKNKKLEFEKEYKEYMRDMTT